jgi:hypothetical protein
MTYARIEQNDDGLWVIKPFSVFSRYTFKTKAAAERTAAYLNAAYAMGRESAWTDLRHLIGAGREGEEE